MRDCHIQTTKEKQETQKQRERDCVHDDEACETEIVNTSLFGFEEKVSKVECIHCGRVKRIF